MVLILECAIICFILLLPCVVSIANGIKQAAFLFEADVQDRVVEMGLFDRFFIDWYWVGHTKAWTIPGTEDLKPYIPRKTLIVKWVITIIGNPLIAAALAGVMLLFF